MKTNFIVNFLKGLVIGIGAITPGVSGGSLAVILGLYEKITDFIANVIRELRENFKQNVMFFLPIALGGAIGVLAFSRVMEFLFENYNVQVKYLFIGLILGTLPLVLQQANSKGFKKTYLIPMVIAFVLATLTVFLSNTTNDIISAETPSFLTLVLYGGILGFGTIVPGISASFILVYLGSYATVLSGVSSLNFAMLVPMAIGFVLAVLIFAKLINFLFRVAYGYTYYTALGFVLGSIVPIFPGFVFDLKHLLCVVLLVVGFAASYYLSKVKHDGEK